MLQVTVLVNSKKCTGCRSCELACSYHFGKEFKPSISAIKVLRNADTGRSKVSISENCDKCNQELVPLCIKCCVPEALFLGRIEAKG